MVHLATFLYDLYAYILCLQPGTTFCAEKCKKKYHLESISYELHVEKQKALYPFSSDILLSFIKLSKMITYHNISLDKC